MPNNRPDSRGCIYDPCVTPGIRFPSILLLFLGGLFCAFLTWALARSLGVPNVPSEWIFAFANEIYWIAGYYWLSYDRGWITLRGRFAPAPRRALLLAASAAFAIMAFFLAVATILQRLGVELKEIPEIDLLHGARTTLPFVFVLIVILAPIAEELLCRGLARRPLSISAAVLRDARGEQLRRGPRSFADWVVGLSAPSDPAQSATEFRSVPIDRRSNVLAHARRPNCQRSSGTHGRSTPNGLAPRHTRLADGRYFRRGEAAELCS